MKLSADLDTIVSATPTADLPVLAGALVGALTAVFQRVAAANHVPAPAAVERAPEELLTVEEAAARLNVTVTWLYRHSGKLPFARKLGRRTLRFESTGLKRWAATRQR